MPLAISLNALPATAPCLPPNLLTASLSAAIFAIVDSCGIADLRLLMPLTTPSKEPLPTFASLAAESASDFNGAELMEFRDVAIASKEPVNVSIPPILNAPFNLPSVAINLSMDFVAWSVDAVMRRFRESKSAIIHLIQKKRLVLPSRLF